MTIPQPLDLENIERKILEEIAGKRQYTLGIGDPEVIRITLLETKQRLKSACEFYLRYKDNPELLIKKHPKYENDVEEFILKLRDAEDGFDIWETHDKYNDWLFKLAFKDVLGDLDE